jgi:hypothetical protein
MSRISSRLARIAVGVGAASLISALAAAGTAEAVDRDPGQGDHLGCISSQEYRYIQSGMRVARLDNMAHWFAMWDNDFNLNENGDHYQDRLYGVCWNDDLTLRVFVLRHWGESFRVTGRVFFLHTTRLHADIDRDPRPGSRGCISKAELRRIDRHTTRRQITGMARPYWIATTVALGGLDRANWFQSCWQHSTAVEITAFARWDSPNRWQGIVTKKALSWDELRAP